MFARKDNHAWPQDRRIQALVNAVWAEVQLALAAGLALGVLSVMVFAARSAFSVPDAIGFFPEARALAALAAAVRLTFYVLEGAFNAAGLRPSPARVAFGYGAAFAIAAAVPDVVLSSISMASCFLLLVAAFFAGLLAGACLASRLGDRANHSLAIQAEPVREWAAAAFAATAMLLMYQITAPPFLTAFKLVTRDPLKAALVISLLFLWLLAPPFQAVQRAAHRVLARCVPWPRLVASMAHAASGFTGFGLTIAAFCLGADIDVEGALLFQGAIALCVSALVSGAVYFALLPNTATEEAQHIPSQFA